jgi:hypothetical protein
MKYLIEIVIFKLKLIQYQELHLIIQYLLKKIKIKNKMKQFYFKMNQPKLMIFSL